ncbi:universal stress protein [Streptomyces cavernicola]|uniref:Universal stress protein n=1 Tax=Streptomyces cavernicola TaxID=3043613 RepID=A0ABT6SHY9_9ACTN|nr:universal stress protein [Streptomyces sp. B-S-A6]MDI3406871.1 universal stress protein [Streptomyces sp. B-S-A6]
MQSPVLVGVDGSEASLTALDWAVAEAERHGSALRIVHASLWERYEGAVAAGTTERPEGQVIAENVLAAAEERARRLAPLLQVTGDVLAEDAISALLREGQHALVLVVGSRGRGGFADLLLGSVGLVVASRAQGPVVVVRGEEHALEAHHRRVLLGVGDHDVDSEAVRYAFQEAAVRGAELDAVRIWRGPAFDPVDHPLLTGESRVHFEERALEELDKALEATVGAYPQVSLRRSTVEGSARKMLADRSAAADLLVLGARRTGRPVGLELGRVAHRALHHAHCPVAVVPQHHPAPTEPSESSESSESSDPSESSEGER